MDLVKVVAFNLAYSFEISCWFTIARHLSCRNLNDVLARLNEESWMQRVVTFLEVLYRFGSERVIGSHPELQQESGVRLFLFSSVHQAQC